MSVIKMNQIKRKALTRSE